MSSSRIWSLRRRLMMWLLGPMLLVSTALFFEAYRNAREAADRAYDRVIAASVLAIADRVVSADGALDVDLPYVALEMLSTEDNDRVFYRIAEPDGALVTGYADLPPPPAGRLSEDEPFFYDAEYRGDTVRVGALTQPITGPGASGRFAVQVAQTRGQRDRFVRELATATATRFMVLVVLIALATWFGVRFGLSPLARLRAALRQRSPHDLRPLDITVPREVREVVAAIDDLMERLARTLRVMEQFISNAAHQLRTPLAALHTQLDLALRERDPEVLHQSLLSLRRSTWRTSRLARQLLNLARTSADANSDSRQSLDFTILVADVTRELVPAALEKNIDLGFEHDDVPARIFADPVLIHELVTNVVDNAVHYCSAGAHVTARVCASPRAQFIRFEVEDNGPGIPSAERTRVLERFYRVSGVDHEGSGLGLAIVRDVTERYGGTINLGESDSGGLLVQVDLPSEAIGEKAAGKT